MWHTFESDGPLKERGIQRKREKVETGVDMKVYWEDSILSEGNVMSYFTDKDVYSFHFTNSHPLFYLFVMKFLNIKYRTENGVVNTDNRHSMRKPRGC
jgi:membrane protease subunit (stomatin/prohibitin family)